MSKPKTRRILPALRLDRKSVSGLVADARHYVMNMKGNIHFPVPEPPLSTLSFLADKLEEAELLAADKTIGLIDIRNVVRKELESALTMLGDYVTSVANKSGDPDLGSLILSSSGIAQRRFTPRKCKSFSVVHGKISGSVIFTSTRRENVVICYEMSKDPTIPESWELIYSGVNVNFVKQGLTPGTPMWFRMVEFRHGIPVKYSEPIKLFIV